ncbi:histidine kinase [Streptomyces sp. NPDC018964]|uniref:histidine kinase n=1 Tax=Streptomyces sp. NPDC018964 TaxID=3365058 RepID=UPI0037BBE06E
MQAFLCCSPSGCRGEALDLAVLAHLLLAFPGGRRAAASDRAVAASGYALVTFGGPARVMPHDPSVHKDATHLSCQDRRPDLHLLPTRAEPNWFDAVDPGYRRAGGAGQGRWAADEERRRLERDLHDGARTRLVFALMTPRRLDTGLSRGDERAGPPGPAPRRTMTEADHAVGQALHELRGPARGIHPAVLTRDGLTAAVRALSRQAHIPVLVIVGLGRSPR